MRCSFLVTIAALVTFVAACDKDNNGGSSKSPGKWNFSNTVNRDAFELRLNELGALAANADRVALPKSETRATGSLRALIVVEAFAGLQASPQSQPAPSGLDADDCANLVSIFGLQASSSADGGSYRLSKGDSCGAAIGSIKSFYSQALDALQVQTASLTKLKAGTVRCGMKIEELPMSGANAAMAYRLTAVDAPVGQIFQQDVMGGANAEEVAYNTRLTVGCSDAKSCGETGISQLSIEGSSEAVGNTVKGTLKLANDYAMSFAFGDAGSSAVTTIQSNSTISGLKDNSRLKVDEAAAFTFAADSQEGAASTKIDLTMTVEELEGGRLKLTGSVKSDDKVLGEQTFTTVLSKESGMCRVLGEDEWQDPAHPTDPSDPNHPSTTDPAAPVFDAGDLEGTWLSTCDNNSLGRLGYPRYEERLTYGAGGDFTHLLTSFGDTECFPGKEQANVALTGSFAVTEALERNYDSRWEYGLNYHYSQLKVTLLTDELVTTFNTAAVCNKIDWAKDTPAAFDAGACFFDLGSYSLLNLSTLKRQKEFTAFVVEAPTIADFARTTDFYGDDGELGRARATNSSERKLKKLPE